MSWDEVLRYHRTQAGIHAPVVADANRPRSILMNSAQDAPYPDTHQGDDIFYIGEGRVGDQMPTRGNRGLIEAEERGYTIRVFEKHRKGLWLDRGYCAVIGHEFVHSENERRRLLRFRLRPIEEQSK